MRISRLVRWALLLTLPVLALTSASMAMAGGPPQDVPAANDHAIVALGKVVDTAGQELDGFAIIHYKQGNAKPEKPVKPPKPDTDSSCYSFLASGAKWKSVEDYVVNASGSTFSNSQLLSMTEQALGTWNSIQGGPTIFGTGTVSAGATAAGVLAGPNTVNEVVFGDYPQDGVIGVTYVYGYFLGKPSSRQLVEWDTLFDLDFAWSADAPTELGVQMDYLNIATHEFGHSAGLGHPSDSCTLETMYRYASYEETIKRDLYDGDIAGILALYK